MAQVWEAVSELRVTGNWVVTGIPRLFYAFEVTLAAGQPHELASLALPTAPPGVPPGATPAEVRADAAVVLCVLNLYPFSPCYRQAVAHFGPTAEGCARLSRKHESAPLVRPPMSSSTTATQGSRLQQERTLSRPLRAGARQRRRRRSRSRRAA